MDDLIGGHRVHHLLGTKRRARHRLAVPVGGVAAFAGPRVGAVDDLPVAVLDIVYHRRLHLLAVIGEDGEGVGHLKDGRLARSEEHTSELQSLMRISYAVFCLKKKKSYNIQPTSHTLY